MKKTIIEVPIENVYELLKKEFDLENKNATFNVEITSKWIGDLRDGHRENKAKCIKITYS